MPQQLQKEEIHQFPDGSLHSFPIDTDPQVITNEILKLTGKTTTAAPALKARMDVEAPLKAKMDVTVPKQSLAASHPGRIVTPSTEETSKGLLNESTTNAIGDLIPYTRTGAATAGAIAADLTGGPSSGAVTFATIDELLRKATGEKSGAISGTENLVASIPEAAVENRIIGKGFELGLKGLGGIFGGLKELLGYSNLTGDQQNLLKLKPSASQSGETPTSHPILAAIEELFAPTAKRAQLDESAKAVLVQSENELQRITGTNLTLPEPHKLATQLKEGFEGQWQKSVNESNARGAATKLIAQANQIDYPVYGKVQTGLDPTGAPIFGIAQTGTRTVNGPVYADNTIVAIHSVLDEIDRSTVPADPDSRVISILKNMLRERQELDVNGQVADKAIDFGTAWKDKQLIDGIAHGTAPPEINLQDKRFNIIAKAINQDIDQSLPAWQSNGNRAQQLWQEAKTIVSKRHEIFDENLTKLRLDSSTTALPKLNTIIDDPNLLRNALKAGKLEIPDGNGFTYITNNTRKDLQGYQIQRMVNDSLMPDPANPAKQVVNAQTLFSKFDDATQQESLKELFGAGGLSSTRQFFKNVAQVSQKFDVSGKRFLPLRIGAKGIELGTGLTAAMLLGSTMPEKAALTATGIGAATLGFHQLAKLLTKTDTARIMMAMGNGSALGMSERLAARIIATNIKGAVIDWTRDDGTTMKLKVNNEGRLEELKK